ncbi:hypothetical protein AB0G60_08310 [Streptomyces angustmyceticus]|uniref:Uncharacterized protein n=1 Tax=Streptomyces angustmyceticus TaxID=285578 RepID=A0A5J4LJD2_9ACTN|nr:hypothetical protein [Streptomyces angustmyceticus]UAL68032.1 hypothetical protein K7396_17175 [Streptomyces angustmyceticus]GES30798.1 hypothetical protein San01_32850 [Streptomyces angustmyceticus]
MSGSPSPQGEDEKDPRFWTRERFHQVAFEGLMFLIKVLLPALFGGGCG